MSSPASTPCPGPLDLLDEVLRRDPYPRYRWYRENDPVHLLAPNGPGKVPRYLLTRWDDVLNGLRDLRLGREVHGNNFWNQPPESVAPEFASYAKVLRAWPMFRDPPRHSVIRKPINRVLDQALTDAAAPMLDDVVEEMAGRLPRTGECELFSEYTNLVPLELDRRLFGLDDLDIQTLGIALQQIGLALGNVFDAKRIAAAARAVDLISSHLEISIRRCREGSGNAPLLERLIQIADVQGLLEQDDLIPVAILLLQAAQESVIATAANGLLCFFRYPEQRRICQSSPGGFAGAVDEVMRFESPVQQLTRHAKEEVEIHGKRVLRGEGVSFLLGAANRDPAVFENPDTFDVTRPISRTASFGFGIHFCPGADLGKCIAARTWEGFFHHFPEAVHDEDKIQWRPTAAFRSLSRLPVRLCP